MAFEMPGFLRDLFYPPEPESNVPPGVDPNSDLGQMYAASGWQPPMSRHDVRMNALSQGLADFGLSLATNPVDFGPALGTALATGAKSAGTAEDTYNKADRTERLNMLKDLFGYDKTLKTAQINADRLAATIADRQTKNAQGDRRLDQGDRRLDQGDRRLDQGDERLDLQSQGILDRQKRTDATIEFLKKRYANDDIKIQQGWARIKSSEKRADDASRNIDSQIAKRNADIAAGKAKDQFNIGKAVQQMVLNERKMLGLDQPNAKYTDPDGYAEAEAYLENYRAALREKYNLDENYLPNTPQEETTPPVVKPDATQPDTPQIQTQPGEEVISAEPLPTPQPQPDATAQPVPQPDATQPNAVERAVQPAPQPTTQPSPPPAEQQLPIEQPPAQPQVNAPLPQGTKKDPIVPETPEEVTIVPDGAYYVDPTTKKLQQRGQEGAEPAAAAPQPTTRSATPAAQAPVAGATGTGTREDPFVGVDSNNWESVKPGQWVKLKDGKVGQKRAPKDTEQLPQQKPKATDRLPQSTEAIQQPWPNPPQPAPQPAPQPRTPQTAPQVAPQTSMEPKQAPPPTGDGGAGNPFTFQTKDRATLIQQFNALPPGSWFVNPANGRTMRKQSNYQGQ